MAESDLDGAADGEADRRPEGVAIMLRFRRVLAVELGLYREAALDVEEVVPATIPNQHDRQVPHQNEQHPVPLEGRGAVLRPHELVDAESHRPVGELLPAPVGLADVNICDQAFEQRRLVLHRGGVLVVLGRAGRRGGGHDDGETCRRCVC